MTTPEGEALKVAGHHSATATVGNADLPNLDRAWGHRARPASDDFICNDESFTGFSIAGDCQWTGWTS
jgi:hypothetical protein